MNRTILQVPCFLLACNLFMNSVDRLDQFRSTNATMRRDKRVPMSLLTYFLDASVQNAYAVLQSIVVTGDVKHTVT